MKDKVYILNEILPETKARYPHITLSKFKTLYDCWRQQGMRQKIHSAAFYSIAWRRGWLYPKDANSLREYIGLS